MPLLVYKIYDKKPLELYLKMAVPIPISFSADTEQIH